LIIPGSFNDEFSSRIRYTHTELNDKMDCKSGFGKDEMYTCRAYINSFPAGVSKIT